MGKLGDRKPVRALARLDGYLRPMQIPLHSAYTTFFLILSIFPLLVLLFGLLGYTSLGFDEVMALVAGLLPEAFLPMAERVIGGAYENTSAMVLSVSVLTALWSASRSMLGLIQGLNAVYGVSEDRGYLKTRSISFVYTVLFVLTLVLTLVLHVFGTTILDHLLMTTDPVVMFLMRVIDLRNVLMLVIQTALFTAMYAFLPNRRNKVLGCLPGAVLAALGWTVCSKLFSLYVVYFPNYANVFGSVYAAALAMMWLYFCINILFYGAALDRYLADRG